MQAGINYHLFITDDGSRIPCNSGKTVLQALVESGIFIEANCGAKGTCGKCKIQLLAGQVAGRKPVQPDFGHTYLACQVYPLSDIIIKLKRATVSQKGHYNTVFTKTGSPLVQKVVVTPLYPTVDNHYSLQEMIVQALKVQLPASQITNLCGFDDAAILRHLSNVVKIKPEHITLTLLDNQLIAVEAGDTSECLYGVAFDIGTTTVVGMLVDLRVHQVVAVSSENNPQASLGADVISRIQATSELEGGLELLTQLIRHCLNQIITALCMTAGILIENVYAVSIAGNATMTHLVLGVSPATLVKKPYAALFKSLAPITPQEIEIAINKQGKIIILPNIASFIGSDTTAAVMAINQDTVTNPIVLVDLGTNGEIVISNGERLVACSTAAGPAFEGAHLRNGMRATDGAIADIEIVGSDILLTIIGGGKPAGICGSGIVKTLAQLIRNDIINVSGRFDKSVIAALPSYLQQRFRKRENQWEFILAEGKESDNGADISITQADIRQLQLVKSSIRTGIEFLIEKLQMNETEFNLCLAGAFGNYIDIDSALTIGMLPAVKKESIVSAGNAAGTGAVQVLMAVEHLQRYKEIAQRVEYMELAVQPDFQKRFLFHLSFPG